MVVVTAGSGVSVSARSRATGRRSGGVGRLKAGGAGPARGVVPLRRVWRSDSGVGVGLGGVRMGGRIDGERRCWQHRGEPRHGNCAERRVFFALAGATGPSEYKSLAVDDNAVVQRVGGTFSVSSARELDERAATGGRNVHGADLAELVERVAQVGLGDQLGLRDAADVKRAHRGVRGRLETAGRFVVLAHQLLGHRVIRAVETIFQVLVAQRVVGIGWLFVPVRTQFTSFALALYPERADVRCVAAIVRCRPSQLGKHVTRRLPLACLAVRARFIAVQLPLRNQTVNFRT